MFFNWGSTTDNCTGLLRRSGCWPQNISETLAAVCAASLCLRECVYVFELSGSGFSMSEDEWWVESLVGALGTFLPPHQHVFSLFILHARADVFLTGASTFLSPANISVFLHKSHECSANQERTATFQSNQAWWESAVYRHHRSHHSVVIVWINVTFNSTFYLTKDKRSKVGWCWSETHRFCWCYNSSRFFRVSCLTFFSGYFPHVAGCFA